METHRQIIFVFLLAALTPWAVSAYSVNTHQGLTQDTLAAYEKWRGETFDNATTRAIMQGSEDEDEGTRPLNHFFDPIHDRGLTEWRTLGLESKQWALDTETQGNYCSYFCFSKTIGRNDKYFSSPTDFSWDRAVYEYAHGDKNRGLATLGHILHLLQDSTVPAHARNDQHLDGDPYETYSSQYGPDSTPTPAKIRVPRHANLSAYFDAVATYTNTHFVSKDTLFTKYDAPSLSALDVWGGFARDREDGHKVVVVRFWADQRTGKMNEEILFDDSKNSITSSNFPLLSAKAIENGVGVIDLFFRSVEAEKHNGTLLAKNTSAFERSALAVVSNHPETVGFFFGSNMTAEDRADLLGNSQVAGAAAALTEERPVPIVLAEEDPVAVALVPESPVVPETPMTDSASTLQIAPVPMPPVGQNLPSPPVTAPPVIPTQQLVPVEPGYGGGGAGGAVSSPQPEGSSVASGTNSGTSGTEPNSQEAAKTEETASSTEATSTPETPQVPPDTTVFDAYGTEHPVMINEVGWVGTRNNPNARYLELANLTAVTVDLAQFRLRSLSASTTFDLVGTLRALSSSDNYQNYFLIANEDFGIVTPNTQIDPTLAIASTGEEFVLETHTDTGWHIVDRTPAVTSGWAAGSGSSLIYRSVTNNIERVDTRSMERATSRAVSEGGKIPSYSDGSLASSWHSNDAYFRAGMSDAGNLVWGTPGVQNSTGLPGIGWSCSDDTSVSNGATYHPSSDICTFYSYQIARGSRRDLRLYKGTIGNAVLVTPSDTYSSTPNVQTTYRYDFSSAQQGDQYFVALFEYRGDGDVSGFEDYFAGTAAKVPHENYAVIPWVFGS